MPEGPDDGDEDSERLSTLAAAADAAVAKLSGARRTARALCGLRRAWDDHAGSCGTRWSDLRCRRSTWCGCSSYDPRSLAPAGIEGVPHAKALVVDDETAFVTSANLTEAAFDRNLELGVLSRDRTLAAGLARHFRILIDQEQLLPLPPRE